MGHGEKYIAEIMYHNCQTRLASICKLVKCKDLKFESI